ncbi:MAG: hypothetical protein H0U46_05630 [Actinobacteria bacterium]|nr:hypothetical protein [Actinomycetota bacterium]
MIDLLDLLARTASLLRRAEELLEFGRHEGCACPRPNCYPRRAGRRDLRTEIAAVLLDVAAALATVPLACEWCSVPLAVHGADCAARDIEHAEVLP